MGLGLKVQLGLVGSHQLDSRISNLENKFDKYDEDDDMSPKF